MDNILFAAIIALTGAFGVLAGLTILNRDRWSGLRSVLIAFILLPVLFIAGFFIADQEAGAAQYALVLTSAQVSPDVEAELKKAMDGDGRMTWAEYRSIVHDQGSMSQEEMRSVAKKVTATQRRQ